MGKVYKDYNSVDALISTNALIKETTIVEEDPKPEPGGIEQYVEISMGNILLSL